MLNDVIMSAVTEIMVKHLGDTVGFKRNSTGSQLGFYIYPITIGGSGIFGFCEFTSGRLLFSFKGNTTRIILDNPTCFDELEAIIVGIKVKYY